MESKDFFPFTLNSGKILSNSFKNNFSEDISFILQNAKSQKTINKNISIENFVPRLRPKKNNIYLPPLKLNKTIDYNIIYKKKNSDEELTKEALSEKENSFSEYLDISSSSDCNEENCDINKIELNKGFSTNDLSPAHIEKNKKKVLFENYEMNNNDNKFNIYLSNKKIYNKNYNIKK